MIAHVLRPSRTGKASNRQEDDEGQKKGGEEGRKGKEEGREASSEEREELVINSCNYYNSRGAFRHDRRNHLCRHAYRNCFGRLRISPCVLRLCLALPPLPVRRLRVLRTGTFAVASNNSGLTSYGNVQSQSPEGA